jgi:SAM-dependent methyltransferase
MEKQVQAKLKFGNWVPGKMILLPAIIGLVFLAAGFIHWAFLIPAGLFILISGYFALAWYIFSPNGGNLQDRILQKLMDQIHWDGKGRALDIGCGNGPLTIKLAQHFPQAQVVGMDYWGKNWDYSRGFCETNARLAGVDGRVTFKHGSASALPFEDASFDLVVSNLVFHEVGDVKDKCQSLWEAFRVLKPGGVFVLQDLFLIKPYYGEPEDLILAVQRRGISRVKFLRTCDEPFIPWPVKLPFMVGTIALLSGQK